MPELRERISAAGLDILSGKKHDKVVDLNGRLITVLASSTRSWRHPVAAWLNIQRWWRDNPDQAAALEKLWVEKYSREGVSQPARYEEETYGYRDVEHVSTAVRATKRSPEVAPTGEPQYVGQRLWTRFTHRVCDRCFTELFPDGIAVPVQDLPRGRCCRCGETTVGSFVRAVDWGCGPHAR